MIALGVLLLSFIITFVAGLFIWIFTPFISWYLQYSLLFFYAILILLFVMVGIKNKDQEEL